MTRVYSDYDRPPAVGLDCSDEPSLTKQSFKDECDINVIMRRVLAGEALESAGRAPMYGDFAGVPDFMAAQAIVLKASEDFAALPAEIRDRFGNDPVRLLEFVGDVKNKDEAIRLGICRAPVVEPPVVPIKVEVVAPPAAGAPEPPKAA